MAAVPEVVECPHHPGVETALRCSRCESAICPACLVHTPVGARCRDCARGSAPSTSSRAGHLLRAGTAAVVGGVVMGVLWTLILLPFTAGFFSLFIGVGLGAVITRLLELATGGKRGPAMVAFAVAGIAIAWGLQLAFTDLRFALWGLVAAGIGVWFAYQNLS